MRKKALVIGCMALISAVFVSSGQTSRTQSSNSGSESISTQRALLDQYCVTCHNQKQNTAGLNLEKLDLARVHDNPEVWEKVIHKIRAGMQPPSGKPRPDAATLDAFVVWLENEIDRNASHAISSAGSPPHQSSRIHERDSATACARDRRHEAFASRRFNTGLRQHGGSTGTVAGIAGSICIRGGQDQPAGNWRREGSGPDVVPC